MSKDKPKFRSVRRTLTPEERERHQLIRQQVDKDRPSLARRSASKKSELAALRDAMQLLKHERETRGLSLTVLADRSGIDKSRLSRLENDHHANPTLDTLARIAQAIGVTLHIGITDEAA